MIYNFILLFLNKCRVLQRGFTSGAGTFFEQRDR